VTGPPSRPAQSRTAGAGGPLGHCMTAAAAWRLQTFKLDGRCRSSTAALSGGPWALRRRMGTQAPQTDCQWH
jgi:hypothetical protein